MAQFVYFTALLVLFGAGDSLETSTSPQQQNAGDTKDLCEVQSLISIFCCICWIGDVKIFCMIYIISGSSFLDWSIKDICQSQIYEQSCDLPFPDLHFDSFSYPVVLIVSSAGGIVKFIYLLFAEHFTTLFRKLQGSSNLWEFLVPKKAYSPKEF